MPQRINEMVAFCSLFWGDQRFDCFDMMQNKNVTVLKKIKSEKIKHYLSNLCLEIWLALFDSLKTQKYLNYFTLLLKLLHFLETFFSSNILKTHTWSCCVEPEDKWDCRKRCDQEKYVKNGIRRVTAKTGQTRPLKTIKAAVSQGVTGTSSLW